MPARRRAARPPEENDRDCTRRPPASSARRVVLVLLGLLADRRRLRAARPAGAERAPTTNAATIAQGRALFLANCATCHGLDAARAGATAPSLIGVGAAAVDFQVGTGRMPLQATGPQAPQSAVRFTPEQISQLAAYVASPRPRPGHPRGGGGRPGQGRPVAAGAAIFRTNCAMCHNFAGQGRRADPRQVRARTCDGTTPTHIFEAMLTGPQSMPVFDDRRSPRRTSGTSSPT